MKRYLRTAGKVFAACVLSIIVISVGVVAVPAAIQGITGLAVAQSSTSWNQVKDANVGDSLASGVMATMIYGFNGTTFDRIRSTITNGLQVDVTRVQAGVATPVDGAANPTTAINTWAMASIFNGTTWDRLRSVISDAQVATGLLANTTMIWNGATYDRLREATADALPATGVPTAGLMGWNGSSYDRLISVSKQLEVFQGGTNGSGTSVWNSASTQGIGLFNSSTTGAANTAVTATIAAGGAAVRAMLHRLDAACSGGSATVTVQDGATTIWQTQTGEVGTTRLVTTWPTALTATGNNAMTVTLGACGVGNTGTLQVQASRW